MRKLAVFACVSLLALNQGLGVSLVSIAGLAVGLFAAVVALLITFQEKLMYVPVVQGFTTVATNPEGYRSPAEYGLAFEETFVASEDGEQIHVWLVHPRGEAHPGREAAQTVADFVFLECHGNAGNLGLRTPSIAAACQNLNVAVCIFDYRGFGVSTGVPSEAGMLKDLQAVHGWLLKKFPSEKIVLHGRSVGGALVVQYAARQTQLAFRAVIAENTFTSIRDVVKTHFPFLRGLMEIDCLAARLLRLQWHTAQWLVHVKHPLLLVSSLHDEIVPHSHRAVLADIATAAKLNFKLETVAAMHNDAWLAGEHYWRLHKAWLSAL